MPDTEKLRPKPKKHSITHFVLATRPAFLSVTAVAVCLGFASARYSGYSIDYATAIVTFLFALIAHAGANVINDYYDALNGCDFAESDRIFPYTGGSRMIQNGTLSQKTMGIFGHILLLSVIPVGIALTLHSGWGLVVIGACGLFIAWAYSAPPFKLQSHGLGELAIVAGWLLVVVGSDFTQRHAFAFTPIAAGLGFALLVANLLFINQFPDIRADTSAGKYTVVVRLGAIRARWIYLIVIVLSYSWILLMLKIRLLPMLALWTIPTIVPNLFAFRLLMLNADKPKLLTLPIKTTIFGAIAYGIILTCVLMFLA